MLALLALLAEFRSLLALELGDGFPLGLLRRARALGDPEGLSVLLHELGDFRLVPADKT